MASTSVKAVIGVVRFSYLHVFEPWMTEEDEKQGKEPQFTATLLIDKKDTKMVDEIRKKIKEAYNASITEKWGGKSPKDGYWFDPLQDGDKPNKNGEDRGEAYAGHWFINAKSRTAPGVVDKSRKPIVDSEEFYSGCFGYASVAFSGYTYSGAMGISCFLNNLMKTKDGEALGGAKSSAEDDFAGVKVDGEDDDI